jgi:hypothetical protein
VGSSSELMSSTATATWLVAFARHDSGDTDCLRRASVALYVADRCGWAHMEEVLLPHLQAANFLRYGQIYKVIERNSILVRQKLGAVFQ